jgi:hypothetical protein
MDDDFNMTLRKFLKQVGVTSQQAIEEAVRKAGPAVAGKRLAARMVLTVEGLDLTHEVTGTITGPANTDPAA